MKYLFLLLGVAQAKNLLLERRLSGTLDWNVDDGNGNLTPHSYDCPTDGDLPDDVVHAAMCGRALDSDPTTIWVSAGQITAPYYTFYTDEGCTAAKTGELAPDTQYMFKRCGDATDHPIAFSTDDGDSYQPSGGIKGDDSYTVDMGTASSLKWKCTTHGNMAGDFCVGTDRDVCGVCGGDGTPEPGHWCENGVETEHGCPEGKGVREEFYNGTTLVNLPTGSGDICEVCAPSDQEYSNEVDTSMCKQHTKCGENMQPSENPLSANADHSCVECLAGTSKPGGPNYEYCQSVACKDSDACNFDPEAVHGDNTLCEYPDDGYGCGGGCADGYELDRANTCCLIENIDCNNDCGGSAVEDCTGECGGDVFDADGDGVCDDVDSCVGTLDACGVCGGSGIPAGDCDCNGNTLDALGACGGSCSADADNDGVCDDVDDCPTGNTFIGCGSYMFKNVEYTQTATITDHNGEPLKGCGAGAVITIHPVITETETVCGSGTLDWVGGVHAFDTDDASSLISTFTNSSTGCVSTLTLTAGTDTDEDGVCDEDEVLGCTDPDAINYKPDATEDDGSCVADTTGDDSGDDSADTTGDDSADDSGDGSGDEDPMRCVTEDAATYINNQCCQCPSS